MTMTDVKSLTPDKLAGMIDQTLLKADATDEALHTFCEKGIARHFASICVNSAVAPYVSQLFVDTQTRLCVTVGFPLGQTTTAMKVSEAIEAIGNGAREVDYVVNVGKVKSGDWAYTENEMQAIVSACHDRGARCKVIFETCYLTEDEKKGLCAVALRVKPDFVKTSTGLASGGATVEDVRLMRACVGEEIGVKAAGGIRTYEDALKMIEAGANRIGTSAGDKILDGFKA